MDENNLESGDINTIALYKKDNKGAIRVWTIEADEYEILMEYGVLDGELQEVSEYIDEGKAGRTQLEQLNLTIQSKIKKKIDKGYVYSLEDAENNPTTNQLGLLLPMLAQRYKNFKGELDLYEATIQYKYNGHRCSIHNDGNRLIAYSRNGIEITSIVEIIELLKNIIPVGDTIDGELYHHGTKLQRIGSWVKKRQKETLDLVYVVYDCFEFMNYENRRILYEYWLGKLQKNNRIICAPSLPYTGSLKEMLNSAIDIHGYEGLIIRQSDSGYEDGKRSKSLLKLKRMEDAEYIVHNIIESKDGWAIFVFYTDEGKSFNATCHGTHEFKTMVFKNREKYRGATVNIEFAELTEDGKPFHPIAINFVNRQLE